VAPDRLKEPLQQKCKEHGAKSKSCDCLLHRLVLTLALSQRARGLEKTHLKIGIRIRFLKPIAFCLLSSSPVFELPVDKCANATSVQGLGDCTAEDEHEDLLAPRCQVRKVTGKACHPERMRGI
jgi:hypothetical protein